METSSGVAYFRGLCTNPPGDAEEDQKEPRSRWHRWRCEPLT